MTDLEAIDLASDSGRAQAETFDRRLRQIEDGEREARRRRFDAPRGEVSSSPSRGTAVDLSTVEDLERQVRLLAEFRRAVLASRGWRALELLRRLTGRPRWT